MAEVRGIPRVNRHPPVGEGVPGARLEKSGQKRKRYRGSDADTQGGPPCKFAQLQPIQGVNREARSAHG